MREPVRWTVLVSGDAATVDAVRAVAASPGHPVHVIADFGALATVPSAIMSDVFAIVLDTSRAAAERLVPQIQELADKEVYCVIVSDEASAIRSPGEAPWEAVIAKPIDLDELRFWLDMIVAMVDSESDHPLRPGEEEEERCAEARSGELHRLQTGFMQRHLMLAETETPDETHSLDFFEMLFGDDNAEDGRVPVAEYLALRAVRWDLDAYLAARTRMREYAKQLPEDVQRAAREVLQARAARRA